MPELSILFPTYNRLPYLKYAIENVVTEFDGIDYELIIADGGSTDGTVDYLEQRLSGMENVRILQMGAPTGSFKAFFACLDVSRGRYILSAGDHILHFGASYKRLIKTMDETDLAAIFLKYYWAGTRPYYRMFLGHWKKRYQGNWLPKLIVAPEAGLYRRSAFPENWSDRTTEYGSYGWSIDLTYQLLANGHSIAHSSIYNLVEIKIREKDDAAHVSAAARNDRRGGRTHLYKKWFGLGKKLKQHLPQTTVWRVRVFHVLLIMLTNLLHTKLFDLISRLTARSTVTEPCEQLIQSIAGVGDMPYSYSSIYAEYGQIDRRIKSKTLEKLYEWLYGQCSACRIHDYDELDDIFLVQKLPETLVE